MIILVQSCKLHFLSLRPSTLLRLLLSLIFDLSRQNDNSNNFPRQILTSSGSAMCQLQTMQAPLFAISIMLTRFVTVDYFWKFPTSKTDRVVITFPVVQPRSCGVSRDYNNHTKITRRFIRAYTACYVTAFQQVITVVLIKISGEMFFEIQISSTIW